VEPETIARLIRAALPGARVEVSGDGRHFEALVVSPAFAGESPLQRQRRVMAAVRAQIDSGELHALSIQARTPEEVA